MSETSAPAPATATLFAWTAPQWAFPAFVNVSTDDVPGHVMLTIRSPAIEDMETQVNAEGVTVRAVVPEQWLNVVVGEMKANLVTSTRSVGKGKNKVAVTALAHATGSTVTLELTNGSVTASIDLPADVVTMQMVAFWPALVEPAEPAADDEGTPAP